MTPRSVFQRFSFCLFSYFFNRHWLKVRPLPGGAVKSVGRGWFGPAMQKHASSFSHWSNPNWTLPWQPPPIL
jgi:hypothetical protein